MERTILALAIAGLSVVAYASPPPGGGPPGPIDVNVVRTVMPFPHLATLVANKPRNEPYGAETCYVVPDSFAYLRVAGLHIQANNGPHGAGPIIFEANVKRGEESFNLYLARIPVEEFFAYFPSPVAYAARYAPLDLWMLPGDQICASVTAGAGDTVDEAVTVRTTILGEGY